MLTIEQMEKRLDLSKAAWFRKTQVRLAQAGYSIVDEWEEL